MTLIGWPTTAENIGYIEGYMVNSMGDMDGGTARQPVGQTQLERSDAGIDDWAACETQRTY